ncbi:SDR family oxidoreductase [Actinacidiphila sp. ITFR-21]|uniref:SDR family oxidoreductase n=1 Tax=Actinacidiphila sp. ITFR-21 TaxID=3075199 RepID=UPI002889BEFB|nr:SDR family oxidoreductase [Streptomyces sp. ITFR-21]WNI15320.1 SDR family oxidoreductase [Streptomyces sp. ITFR-21]
MPGIHSGKVAIVTGASANMGKLFATALAKDGADVMVHYNSDSKRKAAEQVADELRDEGVRAETLQADLTRPTEITRLVDTTLEKLGRWDILVNTSGMIVRKPIADCTEAEWDALFAINAKIPFFQMREAAGKMADNGRIINMITTQVAVTAATYAAYAGSKSPVEHYTKAFAQEIGPRGITVNCVAPGPQKTDFFYNAETDKTIEWLKGMTINGDLGEPTDVVPVIQFLASPGARWVTAQTVYVNGGMISPAS